MTRARRQWLDLLEGTAGYLASVVVVLTRSAADDALATAGLVFLALVVGNVGATVILERRWPLHWPRRRDRAKDLDRPRVTARQTAVLFLVALALFGCLALVFAWSDWPRPLSSMAWWVAFMASALIGQTVAGLLPPHRSGDVLDRVASWMNRNAAGA